VKRLLSSSEHVRRPNSVRSMGAIRREKSFLPFTLFQPFKKRRLLSFLSLEVEYRRRSRRWYKDVGPSPTFHPLSLFRSPTLSRCPPFRELSRRFPELDSPFFRLSIIFLSALVRRPSPPVFNPDTPQGREAAFRENFFLPSVPLPLFGCAHCTNASGSDRPGRKKTT